jgi:1-acyl-sn-glycerol-3-phosphate acyltransferase
MRVRIAGTEHLPATGPVLLACAHISYPDFMFVGRAGLTRGRFVRFLCRHDAWHFPVARQALTGMRHVPVDREAPAHAYLTARRRLRDGDVVCVFPEAGISHAYAVRSLMPGVAALALETGLPIVPVVVWGSQRTWAVGQRPDLTRGRLVDVRFGAAEPVAPTDDVREVTRRLGERLTGLLESVQALPEHRPRPGEHAPWYPAHLGGHAPDRRTALALDSVPHSAVAPTWGPPLLPEAS